MKKYFSLFNVARLVILLQYLLCATMALNLVVVYGLTIYTSDHLLLLLLLAAAITARWLLKKASGAIVKGKESV